MDAIGLSLDEIIKKRGATVRRPNGVGKIRRRDIKKVPSVNGKRNAPVERDAVRGLTTARMATGGKPTAGATPDARLTIIERKRANMEDARDVLTQLKRSKGVDARQRLTKRKAKIKVENRKRRPLYHRSDLEELVEVLEERKLGPRAPITMTRTVHNDMFTLPSSMPPLPTFGRNVRHSPPGSATWSSDPFDCYEVPGRRPTMDQAAPPPPPVPAARRTYEELSPPRPRGILRSRSPPASHTMYSGDRPTLSSPMRTRLERAPNPNESMGIFAKMPPDDHHYRSQQVRSPSPSPPRNGYRIVVSNLHSRVTEKDITELFEDIGDLLESRLVRPGVAEVIYRTLRDAEMAVDAYHNRQLDGQPMKCLLVNPRSSNNPTAPAIKYSSSQLTIPRTMKPAPFPAASKKPPVEIDIDALHKVLFRRDY